jgi:sugar lactone lactonase YvrE
VRINRYVKLLAGGTVALALASLTAGYVLITEGGYVFPWPGGTISMQIKMSTSPAYSDGTSQASAVQAAMQAWNQYLGAAQFAPQVVPAGGFTLGNVVSEVVMASSLNGDAFGTGVLAVTFDSIDVLRFGALQESDLIFNANYPWDSYRGALHHSGGLLVPDIQRVAIHELGHVLGLDHPDVAGQSVVAIMNSAISNLDTLQADDVAGAQFLYGAPGLVPVNDSFSNAVTIELSNNTAQLTGSNIGATKETGEPNHASQPGGHSVWWKWTAPTTAAVTISTDGTNFDTVLGVYTGSTVSSLTAIAFNDDAPSRTTLTSLVTFDATGGTTYYIAVDGWAGYFGQIRLNVTFTGNPGGPPSVYLRPANRVVGVGQTVQFSVRAVGTEPLAYKWQRLPAGNGSWADLSESATYSGTGTNSLSVTNTQLAMSGDQFRCVVTNGLGTATSAAATLSVLLPPMIVTQPQSQVVDLGTNVSFTVTPTGDGALSYQWMKDGANLSDSVHVSGTKSTTLTITGVQASDAGTYTVVVSNGADSVTSNPAVLSVNVPPTISSRPLSRTVVVGQSIAFTIVAADPGPISYQWKHLGVVVAGATGATLTLPNAAFADAGWYEVVVSNASMSASSFFHLRVAPLHGTVIGWGSDTGGQASIPNGLGNVAMVAAGSLHSLAVLLDGSVAKWGSGPSGYTLQPPYGLGPVVAVSTQQYHVLALKADGTVAAWGYNGAGQTTVPAGLSNVIAVANGEAHSVALRADGTVVAWGHNGFDQLLIPAGLNNVVDIACGRFSTVALKKDGTVAAWGTNGTNIPGGLGNVIAVSSYSDAVLALKADGTVVIWGANVSPQDAPPAGLNNVVAVAAGASPKLALKSDGTIVSFGSTPLTLPANLPSVFGIAAGAGHALALVNEVIPAITEHPAIQAAYIGSSATFSVTANGGALHYQWRKDGTDLVNGGRISGVPGDVLSIGNLVPSDAGNYSVLITNDVGSIESNPAALVVNGDSAKIGVSISLGNLDVAYDGTAKPVSVTVGPAVTTLAGMMLTEGSADGTGAAARFRYPYGVAVDGTGTVYVADTLNHTVRKITSGGVVTTLAGLAGSSGFADGTGSAARFYRPEGIAVESNGNLYVADTYNSAIRKISPVGAVTTVAGPSAGIGSPRGVAVDDSGNLYASDEANVIRKITPSGTMTTLAGTPNVPGSADGSGGAAQFYGPRGVAVDSTGNVYVADSANATVRKITPAGVVTTVAGTARNFGTADGTGSAARFGNPAGIGVDSSGNIYVGDVNGGGIRKITPAGVVTTLLRQAGAPFGVAVDAAGNVYEADGANTTIQKILFATGTLTVTYNGSTTPPTEAGSYNLLATLDDPTYQGWGTGTLTIGPQFQVITFNAVPNQPFSLTPIQLSATASSGLPVFFELWSGPATLSGSILTLTGPGVVAVRASQPGDANHMGAAPVERAFNVASTYQSWQLSHFTAEELAKPEISGPNSAYGPDGLSNLVKYALGLDPKRNPADLPELLPGSTGWRFQFWRPTDRSDITYAVEVSTDLTNWSTAGVILLREGTVGEWDHWFVSFPNASAPNVYFRLKVTR